MHALSLLALLLPLVAARKHKQCDCMSWSPGGQWIHNADLTHWVCNVYYQEVNYDSKFDASTGRCQTDGKWKIDGDDWENQCKSEGSTGYFLLDNEGGIIDSSKLHTVGAAAGHC
ncbi:hypothetical protein E4U58_001021 [Claviceps cyperi]|nr:hypothetical protein E4U58_001021 [Claviceps cyperi]